MLNNKKMTQKCYFDLNAGSTYTRVSTVFLRITFQKVKLWYCLARAKFDNNCSFVIFTKVDSFK